MPLILAIGTNLGDKKEHLCLAIKALNKHFDFVAQSRIYTSKAVDYEAQPDFYNQVIEYKTPSTLMPEKIMELILSIEKELGRQRNIPKGPRVIDIDILFISNLKVNTEILTLPHPRIFERSFVVLPLKELPYFNKLRNWYKFPKSFSNSAEPISK